MLDGAAEVVGPYELAAPEWMPQLQQDAGDEVRRQVLEGQARHQGENAGTRHQGRDGLVELENAQADEQAGRHDGDPHQSCQQGVDLLVRRGPPQHPAGHVGGDSRDDPEGDDDHDRGRKIRQHQDGIAQPFMIHRTPRLNPLV